MHKLQQAIDTWSLDSLSHPLPAKEVQASIAVMSSQDSSFSWAGKITLRCWQRQDFRSSTLEKHSVQTSWPVYEFSPSSRLFHLQQAPQVPWCCCRDTETCHNTESPGYIKPWSQHFALGLQERKNPALGHVKHPWRTRDMCLRPIATYGTELEPNNIRLSTHLHNDCVSALAEENHGAMIVPALINVHHVMKVSGSGSCFLVVAWFGSRRPKHNLGTIAFSSLRWLAQRGV